VTGWDERTLKLLGIKGGKALLLSSLPQETLASSAGEAFWEQAM
jgi:hypothetical protein